MVCRHASHFIAAQGMLALASVLSLLRPPKSVVRFAITAAELLTRSAGAYACEAALGWIEPAELSDEVVQAAQATAASLGARQRRYALHSSRHYQQLPPAHQAAVACITLPYLI